MNYIHQDYLPRVTSTLGSWLSKAAGVFRCKPRKTTESNTLLAEVRTTAFRGLAGQLTDQVDQRAVPTAVAALHRHSVLNRYVHTQYKLASYRRMHTQSSSTVHVGPYS